MIPRSILLILCLFSTFGWAAQTRLDMAGLVKLLLAQGYHDIREVELEGDKFEVDTLNADDQRVQLQVDANTGEITKKRPNRPLCYGRDGCCAAPSRPLVLACARGAAAFPDGATAGRRPAPDR